MFWLASYEPPFVVERDIADERQKIEERRRDRERENKEMFGMTAIENQAMTPSRNEKNCGLEGIIGR